MDLRLMILKKFGPQAPRDNIHVYTSDIQRSSSLKLLGQSKPILCGGSLRRGNENLYKWSWSHDQDGCHG